MTESATHRTIFWCIQIFVVLGLVLLIASRMVSMESKMITVTADIKTPAVAGQKNNTVPQGGKRKKRNFQKL